MLVLEGELTCYGLTIPTSFDCKAGPAAGESIAQTVGGLLFSRGNGWALDQALEQYDTPHCGRGLTAGVAHEIPR